MKTDECPWCGADRAGKDCPACAPPPKVDEDIAREAAAFWQDVEVAS